MSRSHSSPGDTLDQQTSREYSMYERSEAEHSGHQQLNVDNNELNLHSPSHRSYQNHVAMGIDQNVSPMIEEKMREVKSAYQSSLPDQVSMNTDVHARTVMGDLGNFSPFQSINMPGIPQMSGSFSSLQGPNSVLHTPSLDMSQSPYNHHLYTQPNICLRNGPNFMVDSGLSPHYPQIRQNNQVIANIAGATAPTTANAAAIPQGPSLLTKTFDPMIQRPTFYSQHTLSPSMAEHQLLAAQLSKDVQTQVMLSQHYQPSMMVPPPSPSAVSYYYQQSPGWLNHMPTYGSIDVSWFQYPQAQAMQLDPTQQQQLIAQFLETNGGTNHIRRLQQQWQPQPFIHPRLELTPSQWPTASGQMSGMGFHHQQQANASVDDASASLLGQIQIPAQNVSSMSDMMELHPNRIFGTNMVPAPSGLEQTYDTDISQVTSAGIMPLQTQESANFVPGSQIPVVDARKTEWRNQLLAYAHQLYSSNPYNKNLLPLLHTLHNLHPRHLPILLLLACVYYTHRNFKASLFYNEKILSIDEHYVEAMSNIGTTLRSMGRQPEAENWWYKAVRRRPNYWDAVENLVGVLCSTSSGNADLKEKEGNNQSSKQPPRYKEALEVCEFVESKVLNQDTSFGRTARPVIIPGGLSPQSIPRIQNLFYAKGNLKYALGDVGGAKEEYEKALEVVFGGQRVFDVIKAIARVATHQMFKGEVIPLIFLLPEQSLRLASSVFQETAGVLPGIVRLVSVDTNMTSVSSSSNTNLLTQANQTTSTVLLTLAKLFQDVMGQPVVDEQRIYIGGGPPSIAILLPLYYFSLSLNASPSTCNNLGILLSTITATATITNNLGQVPVNGQGLAMQYYTYGLQLDQRHPHLYTNLGSLLKDMGYLQEAIKMYQKAVDCNPKFDVALANLGNAVKDMGRVQDSVQWYIRAVEVNPNFAEAVCGLVNALGGICDWRGRGSVDTPEAVDSQGKLIYLQKDSSSTRLKSGWMGKVVDIVNKQLNEGVVYGSGMIRNTGSLEHWLNIILEAIPDADSAIWTKRLCGWISRARNRAANQKVQQPRLNEGGWIIRMVEKLIRRVQRRWYCDVYGENQEVETLLARIQVDPNMKKYNRPQLPHALPQPPVPTVLPFHTFTYPLSPREVRLISHRNGLRISHTTLNAPWLLKSVYPPPPPPTFSGKGRLRIGYVSSDFNNHPLSHLMESVFGFHDLTRYEIICYATTPSDRSPYRQKVEREAEHFFDVSSWSNQQIVEKIVQDGIHVLVNLNGYTKGARNEVFAARPCPVQTSFMGFAGTLGGGWCDWIIADAIVCPPEMVSCEKWRRQQEASSRQAIGDADDDATVVEDERITWSSFEGDLDPEESDDDWVYTEKMIYMPHSYFVNDHKQGFRDEDAEAAVASGLQVGNGGLPSNAISSKAREQLSRLSRTELDPEGAWLEEQDKRWKMRKELFPGLDDDFIIFANFNQLYKIDPVIFKTWLRILARVPKSILWLLRFPADGEKHLAMSAQRWAGKEVASRVIFTDVAPKHIHIHRGRIADLFLDTPECNAHTTAADILWSGTPILTYPRHMHKMCSRVASSIVKATGYGEEMTVYSMAEYESKAVDFTKDLAYDWVVENENGQLSTHLQGVSVAELVQNETEDGQTFLSLITSSSQSALNQSPNYLPIHGENSLSARIHDQVHTASSSSVQVSTIPHTLTPHTEYSNLSPSISNLSQQSHKFHRLGRGSLMDLRKKLFLTRETSRLFDTKRWTRNLERGLEEAWRRWVVGAEMEDVGTNFSVKYTKDGLDKTGCIWIVDPDD